MLAATSSLLDRKISQMAVRFREFRQFRLIVDVRFRQLKAAKLVGNISLNVNDTVDGLQIASN